MWGLYDAKDDRSYFTLLCDSSSTVSRDGPGHIILHDKTVSKEHASFCLTYHDKHLSCPEKLPEVVLWDLKSTNGTYVCSGTSDYKKLAPSVPVVLKQGDSIKFGRNKIFRLKYSPFVVTSSQITGKEAKEQLKQSIMCLGGHLVKEWIPSCSLLVMNELVVTTKTVCALAAGANIVTPAYLIDKIAAIKKREPLPDIKKYLPVLKEPSIRAKEVSFHPNPARRELFRNKKFFFQNESSLKKMKQAVVEAGGIPVLLSENNYQQVLENNSVFIKAVAEKHVVPKYVSNCFALLKNKEWHPIPESDVGLAVIYNSIDKYCNPKFRMSGILLPNTDQSPMSSLKLEVYATETQQETENISINLPSRTTIPESGRSSLKSTSGVSISKSFEQQQKASVDNSPLLEMNKENLGGKKRSFADSTSPNDKIAESKSKKTNLSRIPSDIVDLTFDDEIDTCHFQPSQFSTEKLSPDKNKKRKADDFVIPESSEIRKNVRLATPLKVTTKSCQDTLEISCIPKSIPFDPYTLPSINPANMEVEEPSIVEEEVENEDEKETEIFSGSISREAKNELISYKPNQIEETPQSKDGWIKAIPKSEAEINAQLDKVKSPSDSFKKPDPVSIVKEIHVKAENDFAITFSGRKRKGRLFSEKANSNQPSSKREKIEEPDLLLNANKPPVARIIKKSPSVVEREMHRNERESPPDYTFKEEVKEAPFLSSQKTKLEKDISDLSEAVEKSFMIVEIVDNLIVKKSEPEESFSSEQSNGLPNYKAFVKVWPNTSSESSLPRIIGGSDLVSSDESFRRQSFLASQPPLPEHLARREQEMEEFRKQFEGDRGSECNNRLGPNRVIDSDFLLLTSTGRRKGRLR